MQNPECMEQLVVLPGMCLLCRIANDGVLRMKEVWESGLQSTSCLQSLKELY